MRKFIFSLLVMCFLCTSVHANNVDTFGIGSKATAMGGAFSAYADDPFAAYYNPAGLTQITSMTVAVGAAFMDPTLKAKGYTVEKDHSTIMGPTSYEDESDLLVVPHLGYAMPLGSKFAFGIAMYAPYGLHLKWDDTNDAESNPGAFNSYESWYTRAVVTPTVAYKFNDKFSFGFGVSIGKSESGTYSNSYDLYKKGITGAIEGDLEDELNYSWNVGVLYKHNERLSFGLTYRSKADAEFEGDLKLKLDEDEQKLINKSLSAAMGLDYEFVKQDNNFKSDISLDDVDHPEQIQFGVKYSPTPKVNIVADLVWTQWSIVDTQSVIIKDKYFQALLAHKLKDGNKEVYQRRWQDTRQVKVGLEYLINDMFTFRCGYFYDPSPIPDDTFDIVWADADKKTYSVGLGVNLGQWTIDGSIQYTRTEMDRMIGGGSENLNHSYGSEEEHVNVVADAEGQIYGYSMTVTYKF